MYTHDFSGKKLSALGFGAMRLPLTADGDIDSAQLDEMVAYAMEQGINYYDTAWPYHNGLSEIELARSLRRYPRDSYYLATKYPGHQISKSYDPAATFEQQLKKCQVDYFDFYLLHNVNENSISNYMDPQWGMLDYFVEQKKQGRIKHLGFSSHAGVEALTQFLDYAGDHIEFCQIQLNYLDWTLQQASEKVALLQKRNVPIWVMEPVRGGKLAQLDAESGAQLQSLQPGKSAASFALRFLQDIPGVTVILSGMSDMAQMKDNVETFRVQSPLSAAEKETLFAIAERMKDSVPCTACRYCTKECPQGLDIPTLISFYNEVRFSPEMTVSMRMDAIPPQKQPANCLACGRCAAMCPQGIAIPDVLHELAEIQKTLPSWAELCRQREEEAAKIVL